MRVYFVVHKVFFCVGSFAVTVFHIYVSLTSGVLHCLVHKVQRLWREALVALQVEVSQREVVGCEVEEFEVASLCRQCLEPFQATYFEAVDAQRVAHKGSQTSHF